MSEVKPEIDMERALELAKRAVNGGFIAPSEQGDICRALIARMEPVEISPYKDYTLIGICSCGETCSLDSKFCSGCGRPIKWTN